MMDTISLHHWVHQLQKSVGDSLISTLTGSWTTFFTSVSKSTSSGFLLQAWSCWLVCYQERQVMREKAATAGAHHQRRVLRECWAAWQVYMDLRQRKNQLRGKLMTLARFSVSHVGNACHDIFLCLGGLELSLTPQLLTILSLRHLEWVWGDPILIEDIWS